MVRVVAVAAAAGLLGCYKPAPEQACATLCSATDRLCPPEMTCGADLRCHVSGEGDCTDGGVDDALIGPRCYGALFSGWTPICDPPDVPATRVFDSDFDTSSADCTVRMQMDGSSVCVLLGRDITVSGSIHVTGPMPLVLLATHDLTVEANAVLDVGSRTADNLAGPGHRRCDVHAGADNTNGGGGGAGGGFGDAGGSGGSGYAGAAGGIATLALPVPQYLVGGCDGSPSPVTGANQGFGGGGVYLLAGGVLQIDGAINAGGGGGRSGAPLQGGGGGGSGGLIALEARVVNVASTAILSAHGGGGSGGAGATSVVDAGDANTTYAHDNLSVPGTSGTAGSQSVGGTGGRGSITATPFGTPGQAKTGTGPAGGGGGGGGQGYILIDSAENPLLAGIITPAPM